MTARRPLNIDAGDVVPLTDTVPRPQLEISQRHPDIYAVPLKTAKLERSRPQPIG